MPSIFPLLAAFRVASALAIALGLACLARAASPEPPRIPDREFSARRLGVVPGSASPVTGQLQAAIDHVAREGGGRLVLEPGDYVAGPVTLPSRFDLHLPAGTVVRLLPRGQDYPLAGGRYLSLFSAVNATDIRISGAGRIDGQGEAWWRAFRAKELTLRRPQLVLFERCDRVELTDFTTLNPPNTHFALRLCRDVTMRGLTLEAPDESPNTDGINVSGKNYLIERCRISTGDDNIVILTHTAPDWPAPLCENFVIRDCSLGFGHGLSIGSFTGGGIRGLLAERITFDSTSGGVRMKAARDRGGLVEDLVYRDLTMRGVRYPVFISSYYPKEPKRPELDAGQPLTDQTPRWRNILIERLRSTDSENSIILWGLPELPLGAITLRDATFASRRGARIYNAPATTLDQVEVTPESGPAYDRWPAP